MKVGIYGSRGRMGQTLLQACERLHLPVAGAVDQGDSLETEFSEAETILDFSFHEATVPFLQWAARENIPVVIGTTGHTEKEAEEIRQASERIPIVWAGNYSVGVNVLLYLTRLAAEKLGETYDPEIIEAHHKMKRDAPSGTAQNLVDAVLDGLQWSRESVIFGREGITGQRPEKQLGVHAVRGGDIIGDHTVLFAGSSERIELSHRAGDRTIFAEGALRAAQWAFHRGTPGLYSMQDVLGLKE